MKVRFPDQEFADFMKAGQFMLPFSPSSGQYFFPPRVAEPRSGALDVEWRPAKGTGVVYSITEVSQKPPRSNTNVVLVDLDEGPRIISRIENPGGVPLPAIGDRVKARIETTANGPVIVFESQLEEAA